MYAVYMTGESWYLLDVIVSLLSYFAIVISLGYNLKNNVFKIVFIQVILWLLCDG